MQVIYNNQKLSYILSAVLDGTAGFANINDLLITNHSESKYNEIAIKPCSINITEQILEVLSETKIKPELIDTELNEFICYTKTIDSETNEEILLNQSLTEMILIDSEILNSIGWRLTDFSEY